LHALWISLALIGAVLVVYIGVHQFGFVSWDDPQYVRDNSHVLLGLGWPSIHWAFTTTYAGLWLPLTWLSFMLDVDVWGPGAGGHHVTNVVLHAANTLLLFGLLHRTTGALSRSAFVAALFAVHPLHVESVAWVTERKDVLSTFFGLIALWAYAGYVKRPALMRYLGVVGAFALGLMAKPMLVTLPLVLLVMDVWPLGRLQLPERMQPRFAAAPVSAKRVAPMRPLREKAPLLIIALLSGAVTYAAQRGAGAVSVLEALPLGDRVQNALVSYVAYIAKMLWPSKLAGLYPYHPLSPTLVFGTVVLLVAITASSLLAAKRYPYLAVGWLWYLVTLLPVIGLVQVGIQARADRFTYIPLIGLFIIVAWGTSDLAARLPRRHLALTATALVVVIACAITARAQVGHWRDSLTFWQHTVDVTADNARARGNLGLALADVGKVDEAIAQYTEAIRISPDLADVHTNLANALAGKGMTDSAVAHYQEALRFAPNSLEAHNGLGSALDDQGRYAEAIVQYGEALRIDSGSAMIHNNLGASLVHEGRLDEAVSHLIEAARLAPDDADFHYNAAAVLDRLGRYPEAVHHLEEALRRRPGHADARQLLERLRASGLVPPSG
jgi:tetratricopeptide (TPR) repeat protein